MRLVGFVGAPWVALAALWLLVASACVPGGAWQEAEEDADPQRVMYPEVQAFERPAVRAQLTWSPATSSRVPLALTASDGTGLRLVGLRAEVVIEDPLAFTQLHLTFENTEDRVREGRFEIELPEESALSRFAMKIDDAWQEAEVVERRRAQATFESYMHERPNVDPALLEHAAGNRFAARVFPIPARAKKELVVAYSQPVRGESYRLPLQGLPAIDALDIEVEVHGSTSADPIEFSREKFEPTADLVIALADAQPAAAVVGGKFVVARVRPTIDAAPDPVDALTILVDTSASAGPGLPDALTRLADTIAALDRQRDIPVRVVAFDQERVEIFAGSASEFGTTALPALQQRRPLGASDLHAALAHVAAGDRAPRRMLVVTDGIVTAGPGAPEIEALLTRLARRGLERIDVMPPAGNVDTGLLRRLSAGPLPRAGIVLATDLDADLAAEHLQRKSLQGVGVRVEGAKFTWPERLDGVLPGDDVFVYAELVGAPHDAIRIVFDGGGLPIHEVDHLPVEEPLVERAVAGARIARVQRALEDAKTHPVLGAYLRDRLVEISTTYRVVAEPTAMLVLESDAEYAMFGLPRLGKTDILAVMGSRIVLLERGDADEHLDSAIDLVPTTRWRMENAGVVSALEAASGHYASSPYGGAFVVDDDEDVWGGLTGSEIGEAYGVGGLGLVGTGGGGGGTGEGTIGLGNHGFIGRGSGNGYGRGSGAGFGGRGGPRRTTKGVGHLGGSMHMDFVGLGLVSQIEEATKLAKASAELARAHAIPDAPEGATAAAPAPAPRRKRRAPEGLRSSAARFVDSRFPIVRQGKPKTTGPLDRDIVRRIIRAHVNEIRFCYHQAISIGNETGDLTAAFEIDAGGRVLHTTVSSPRLAPRTTRCVARTMERWKFPAAGAATQVDTSWSMTMFAPLGSRKRFRPVGPPHEGGYAAVHAALHDGAIADAVELAELWVAEQPADVVALLALGEALETDGQRSLAARVYGSIIDLQPDRADLRRVAGERLHRLGGDLSLAIDTFEKAIAQRPDHVGAYRLLAMSRLQAGFHERAFDTLEDGLRSQGPAGRFEGSRGLLSADLELVGAIWAARDPDAVAQIDERLERLGLARETQPSARAVVHWETDASDVDLHVDATGGAVPRVRADVIDGYGPEWAITRDDLPSALRIRLHHYARGPVGYAGGSVHILTHDGAGGFDLTTQPFLLMTDHGLLDLGTFTLNT